MEVEAGSCRRRQVSGGTGRFMEVEGDWLRNWGKSRCVSHIEKR